MYSQADLEKVPGTVRFAEIVFQAFIRPEDAEWNIVEQWAVCMEDHGDGEKHYHVAVKLTRPRRGNPVSALVLRMHGIYLHFLYSILGAFPHIATCAKSNPATQPKPHRFFNYRFSKNEKSDEAGQQEF